MCPSGSQLIIVSKLSIKERCAWYINSNCCSLRYFATFFQASSLSILEAKSSSFNILVSIFYSGAGLDNYNRLSTPSGISLFFCCGYRPGYKHSVKTFFCSDLESSVCSGNTVLSPPLARSLNRMWNPKNCIPRM